MTDRQQAETTPDPVPDGGYAAQRLHLLREDPRTGADRRRALAELTDRWLSGLFSTAAAGLGGVALVAVGGYGRG